MNSELLDLEVDPPEGTPEWDALWRAATTEFNQWQAKLAVSGLVAKAKRKKRTMLATSEGLHRDLLVIADTPLGRKYLSDGVTVNPEQTFGVEIEYQGGDRGAIAQELHIRGLAPAQAGGYHSGRVDGLWSVETDASCSGGEIVSPIMRDRPGVWFDIATVCDIIKKHGGYVDHNNGAHVHVGVESTGFEDPLKGLKNVAKLYYWSEDLLYRIGASPEHYPFHRGMTRGYNYCPPLTDGRFRQLQDASSQQELGIGRYGVNFNNVTRRGRTVEFRFPDGTLDPERIQSNIMVCCALMHAASELAPRDIPNTHHPLGIFANSPDSEDTLLRQFSDLVLDTSGQRLKLYSTYQRGMWQAPAEQAEQRKTAIRQEAVANEVARIGKAMDKLGIAITAEDRAWLAYAIARQPGEPREVPSEQASEAYRWWLSKPLPRKVVDRTEWEQARVARATQLLAVSERDRIVQQSAASTQRGGVPMTEMERGWLKAVLSEERSSIRLLAPTGRVEGVYRQLMTEAARTRDDGGFDVRRLPGVQDRWQRYQELEPCSQERDRIAAGVASDLGRRLTDVEEDAISQLARYDLSFDADQVDIRSTACLDSIIRHARESEVFGDRGWLKRIKPLEEKYNNVHYHETLDGEVEKVVTAFQGATGHSPSDAEKNWVVSLITGGLPERWDPCSHEIESAMFAWAESPLDPDVRKHPNLQRVLIHLQRLALHNRDITGLLNATMEDEQARSGREPTVGEYGWMKAVLLEGRISRVPSLAAGQALSSALAPEAPPTDWILDGFWKAIRNQWLAARNQMLKNYHLEQLAGEADGAHSQDQVNRDHVWLEAMLTTLDSDMYDFSPSNRVVESFEQWHAQPIPGFDAETAALLQQATDANWDLWKTYRVASAYRSTLSDAIVNDTGDSPKVTSWCRRLTTPSTLHAQDVRWARPPSPDALVETAKWMQIPAEGEPDVVATFENMRQKAWVAACAEIRQNMKLWMRPHWKKAVNTSEAIMAGTSAEHAQPVLEAQL